MLEPIKRFHRMYVCTFAVQILTLHPHSKMKRAFKGTANYDFEERSQIAKSDY